MSSFAEAFLNSAVINCFSRSWGKTTPMCVESENHLTKERKGILLKDTETVCLLRSRLLLTVEEVEGILYNSRNGSFMDWLHPHNGTIRESIGPIKRVDVYNFFAIVKRSFIKFMTNRKMKTPGSDYVIIRNHNRDI